MAKEIESRATKVANGIRRVASELLGWAFLDTPYSWKDGYKHIPLGIAIIGIVLSVLIISGTIFGIIWWVMQL